MLSFPLSAFNWGGFLDNASAYEGGLSDMGFEQTNRFTLWFRAPFNESMYLTAETFYEFDYIGTSKTISHKVDLNLLKLRIALPMGDFSSAIFNAGRYSIRDITGLIISQPSDGVEFVYTNDIFSLGAYIGFTGLLNNLTVDINSDANTLETSSVYALAPPFILASITAQFPFLFAQQSLSTDFYAALDVSSDKNKNHRMYATAALNGPISDSFFYIFSTTLGVIQATDAQWQISNLSIFEISAYLPVFSALLSWKTTFATGGDDAEFQTFTVATANVSETMNYAGNIKTGLIGSMRPISSLLFFAGVDTFFSVMNDDSNKGYAGLQWAFSTRWQIVSDVQLSVSAKQFFPADTAIDSYMSADLKVSFSF